MIFLSLKFSSRSWGYKMHVSWKKNNLVSRNVHNRHTEARVKWKSVSIVQVPLLLSLAVADLTSFFHCVQ